MVSLSNVTEQYLVYKFQVMLVRQCLALLNKAMRAIDLGINKISRRPV